MFGRATIRLGIGPHSSLINIFQVSKLQPRSREVINKIFKFWDIFLMPTWGMTRSIVSLLQPLAPDGRVVAKFPFFLKRQYSKFSLIALCSPGQPRFTWLAHVHLADPCSPGSPMFTWTIEVHLANPGSPGWPMFTWLTHVHLANSISPGWLMLTWPTQFHQADPCSPGQPMFTWVTHVHLANSGSPNHLADPGSPGKW